MRAMVVDLNVSFGHLPSMHPSRVVICTISFRSAKPLEGRTWLMYSYPLFEFAAKRGLCFLVLHRLAWVKKFDDTAKCIVDDILRYAVAGHDEENPRSSRLATGHSATIGFGTADVDDGDGAIVDGGGRSESTRPE